jgi:hypothetical protein
MDLQTVKGQLAREIGAPEVKRKNPPVVCSIKKKSPFPSSPHYLVLAAMLTK